MNVGEFVCKCTNSQISECLTNYRQIWHICIYIKGRLYAIHAVVAIALDNL